MKSETGRLHEGQGETAEEGRPLKVGGQQV